MKIYFTVAIHIIVLSRSPGEADAGSKTIIGMAELVQDIRVKIRKDEPPEPARVADLVGGMLG